jgi:hypothetical protein
MSSVELPDDNEKSVSSASTSPCPSPKSHRLLATNLYVVLYNYTPRQEDELDLRAGYKLTVIDAISDKDWWKGKCFGAVGVFPSNYVTQLHPGEKPLQVTQTVQINATSMQEPPIKLLRDQIVIQIEDRHGGGGMSIDANGCILIRTDDHRQGFCPVSHLQEV